MGLWKGVNVDLKIWLAFGVGLFIGGCGMAILIGYVESSVKKLREKNERWWKENCHLYTMPHAREFPRIVIGYFQADSRTAELKNREES